MRLADLGQERMLRQRRLDPREEIAAVRLIVGMLELAPSALREMAARRLLVVRTRRKCAIVEKGIAGDSERDMPTA